MDAAARHHELTTSVMRDGKSLCSDDIEHHFCSGVYAKQVRMHGGSVLVSHRHSFDHMSILAAGRVRVVTDDDDIVYAGPAVLTIRAGLNHAVHALTDATWFCIHATTETDPGRVDEVLIDRIPA